MLKQKKAPGDLISFSFVALNRKSAVFVHVMSFKFHNGFPKVSQLDIVIWAGNPGYVGKLRAPNELNLTIAFSQLLPSLDGFRIFFDGSWKKGLLVVVGVGRDVDRFLLVGWASWAIEELILFYVVFHAK